MRLTVGKLGRIVEPIYLAFLGFVAFSKSSQYFVFDVLHLPFYLIEVFFIPFFLYAGKEYYGHFRKVLKRPYFVLWALVLIYDIFAAIIYTSDITNSLAMSRALVYVVMICLIFMEKKQYHIDKLFIISVAAMIGEMAYGSKYASDDIASINTTCLALMVLIPVIQKRYIIFMLCSVLGLIVSINSGYRIGIIVLIVAILEGLAWTVLIEEKRTVKNLLKKLAIPAGGISFFAILAFNYEKVVEFTSKWLGTSQYAIFRVTERLVGLFKLDFQMSREQERFDKYYIAIDSFWERVIPRGLVGKSIGTLHEYFDVPITILYDAFGSIAAWIVFAVCAFMGFKCFVGAFKKKTPDTYVLAGLMFPVLLLCMMTNGSFLYITFQCITTGIFLGGWFSYSRESSRGLA